MKTEKEFVESGGNTCPCCDSHSIEGESLDCDGSTASQKVRCLDCKAVWDAHYDLVSFDLYRSPEQKESENEVT